MIASYAALASLFVALLVAPLALGSFVVIQRSSERITTLWFGALTALLLMSLLTATLGLLLAAFI